jgi:hypothetical protein
MKKSFILSKSLTYDNLMLESDCFYTKITHNEFNSMAVYLNGKIERIVDFSKISNIREAFISIMKSIINKQLRKIKKEIKVIIVLF